MDGKRDRSSYQALDGPDASPSIHVAAVPLSRAKR
jgi:hypothetical protein